MELSDKLKQSIRTIENYPKPGISFKDITPVFSDVQLMSELVSSLADEYRSQNIDAIVGVEARGFILSSVLAHQLNCRFVPVRKKGKLPYKTISVDYALEYGTAALEMHIDAIKPGWRVLIHDDLLATGGTAAAAGQLVKKLEANVVGFSFIVNLGFLSGEQNLLDQFGVKPHYIVKY